MKHEIREGMEELTGTIAAEEALLRIVLIESEGWVGRDGRGIGDLGILLQFCGRRSRRRRRKSHGHTQILLSFFLSSSSSSSSSSPSSSSSSSSFFFLLSSFFFLVSFLSIRPRNKKVSYF
jgi:hypothetical protein